MRRALSFENIEVAQDAQGTSEYGASLALAEARRVLTELHCETNELEGEHDKHAWEYEDEPGELPRQVRPTLTATVEQPRQPPPRQHEVQPSQQHVDIISKQTAASTFDITEELATARRRAREAEARRIVATEEQERDAFAAAELIARAGMLGTAEDYCLESSQKSVATSDATDKLLASGLAHRALLRLGFQEWCKATVASITGRRSRALSAMALARAKTTRLKARALHSWALEVERARSRPTTPAEMPAVEAADISKPPAPSPDSVFNAVESPGPSPIASESVVFEDAATPSREAFTFHDAIAEQSPCAAAAAAASSISAVLSAASRQTHNTTSSSMLRSTRGDHGESIRGTQVRSGPSNTAMPKRLSLFRQRVPAVHNLPSTMGNVKKGQTSRMAQSSRPAVRAPKALSAPPPPAAVLAMEERARARAERRKQLDASYAARRAATEAAAEADARRRELDDALAESRARDAAAAAASMEAAKMERVAIATKQRRLAVLHNALATLKFRGLNPWKRLVQLSRRHSDIARRHARKLPYRRVFAGLRAAMQARRRRRVLVELSRTLILRNIALRWTLKRAMHLWAKLAVACRHDRHRAVSRALKVWALALYLRRSSFATSASHWRARVLSASFSKYRSVVDIAKLRRDARDAQSLARVLPLLRRASVRRSFVAWNLLVIRLRDARRRAERRSELFRLAQSWLQTPDTASDSTQPIPEESLLTNALMWFR